MPLWNCLADHLYLRLLCCDTLGTLQRSGQGKPLWSAPPAIVEPAPTGKGLRANAKSKAPLNTKAQTASLCLQDYCVWVDAEASPEHFLPRRALLPSLVKSRTRIFKMRFATRNSFSLDGHDARFPAHGSTLLFWRKKFRLSAPATKTNHNLNPSKGHRVFVLYAAVSGARRNSRRGRAAARSTCRHIHALRLQEVAFGIPRL